MKILIEKSIEIYGMGHPQTKTVFNIEKEIEKKDLRFKSLTTISGRKLTVWFKYTENNIESNDKFPMTVIKSDNETEIKDFILTQINNYL
jgi:hypothetical protein